MSRVFCTRDVSRQLSHTRKCALVQLHTQPGTRCISFVNNPNSVVSSDASVRTSRQRRDDIWIPTVSLGGNNEPLDITQLLVRAGYLRQAYSGIYHMLPLGVRVQNKLEALIDKHMQSISASKVSLSSISSQALWARSGRLGAGSEFFKFSDRKDSKWLLAPTHEEEITSLVKDLLHSPTQLPIRLYQISRKYRDEKRPRGGLLRGREFIMKDLYTFDLTQAQAHSTYDQVRQAYRNFLDDLKLPYVEARADSGNMGGSLSHEYHFPSAAGEDDVISCNSCSFARNEEWVPNCQNTTEEVLLSDIKVADTAPLDPNQLVCEIAIDKSRTCLVKAYALKKVVEGNLVSINSYAVKAACDSILDLDTGVEQAERAFMNSAARSDKNPGTVYYLFDPSIAPDHIQHQIHADREWLMKNKLRATIISLVSDSTSNFSLLKQTSGDSCPQCQTGVLKVQKAIEIGHTFHLGTRYSTKLGLTVKATGQGVEPSAVEMGCHGIGVSRLVAAIASAVSDTTGLAWPAAIAPYQVVIVADKNESGEASAAEDFYDSISTLGTDGLDVLLDDRANTSMGYKLKDADLIGYPVIVVFGRSFRESGRVEVQCRRLNLRETLSPGDACSRIHEVISAL